MTRQRQQQAGASQMPHGIGIMGIYSLSDERPMKTTGAVHLRSSP